MEYKKSDKKIYKKTYKTKRITIKKPKGYVTQEKAQEHAQTLANSVKKKYKHLAKKFRKQNIECFRLYDWDSPDIRVVVDWYAEHLVVAEYEREQTSSKYIFQMADAVAAALDVAPENVHVKKRRTKVESAPRYSKLNNKNQRFVVNERDIKLWINPSDYLDTGLYSDHRNTRVIIKDQIKDKDFLNLFAYTGVVSCAAALGEAKSIVTVDRSETYIRWARDNFELNAFKSPHYKFVQSDVMTYLKKAERKQLKFDFVFVDPPSFYNDEQLGVSFDIKADHPKLLKAVIKLVRPGGDIFFSTNHQRFEEDFSQLKVKEITKLTPKTIPEDYRNKQVHQCWHLITNTI